MGQRERHVARVVGLAEALPLGVFGRVEDLADVARRAELRVAGEIEQLGAGRGDERRVRRGGHLRDALQAFHVFRTASELEVAHEGRERSAAEDAELFFVHLL